MKKAIYQTIIDSVLATDDFTQSAVLGACYYTAASAALNHGLRLISAADIEPASGIDGFTRWMERISALNGQEIADLKSLGMIAEKFASAASAVSMNESTLENHLAYRLTRKPSREDSEMIYRKQRQQGAKFTVSMKQWVDDHYATACESYSRLVRHGEEAIKLVNRALREGTLEDWEQVKATGRGKGQRSAHPGEPDLSVIEGRVPEWLDEQLMDKALTKLYDRRTKVNAWAIDITKRQPKRDAAMADLAKIDAAITALGETPPAFVYVDEDGNPESYSKVVKKGRKLEIQYEDHLF